MRFEIRRYDKVDSTNAVARELADDGVPEGTVVVAEVQTAGKGRKGDYWHSPRGGLWFTIILRPDVPPQKSVLLPLLAGIAVHRAVKGLGVETRIKLPNDVIARDKKLCGILCENRIGEEGVKYILAGIGINVLNRPPGVGISLKELVDKAVSLEEVLALILKEFEKEYEEFLRMDYFFGED